MTTDAPRLRPPHHRVDRRAIRWWTTRSLAVTVVLTAIPLVPAIIWEPPRTWFLLATAVVGGVGLLITVLMPQWRYRVHRWEVTDTAVYTSSGWIWQEWRVAPMSRIQTVDTARGPLQRMFGLSSVTVTTASAAGPIEIAGLDHVRATEVAEQLTETTQATPGDAT
ncbi:MULTISPECIES: PH domain-containing protein [Nocardiopsis]|jgi:membrane protein YdbS with pleckstrin-like domain|uniref:PH domain-containing protein n=1 Tax=Nocardiopsis tropica TaxID=109330 RepID=A0ABU7KSV5_9ACTN|nr:PH domain-containing protein [Nocardiopsis umidischolae]MEE2052378.1 PH domain-containing protein [Nocardiopsis umidischolae]